MVTGVEPSSDKCKIRTENCIHLPTVSAAVRRPDLLSSRQYFTEPASRPFCVSHGETKYETRRHDWSIGWILHVTAEQSWRGTGVGSLPNHYQIILAVALKIGFKDIDPKCGASVIWDEGIGYHRQENIFKWLLSKKTDDRKDLWIPFKFEGEQTPYLKICADKSGQALSILVFYRNKI